MSTDQREYIIKSEFHLRWWLPDNIHYVDEMHLNKRVYLKVVNSHTRKTKQEFNIAAEHPHRELLLNTFSESAEKKYPRNIMKRADSINRLTRRDW